MMATTAALMLVATTVAEYKACCDLTPSCPATFRQAEKGECTRAHRAFKQCRKETKCCQTIECIREAPEPLPSCCEAKPLCGDGYANVELKECSKLDFFSGVCMKETLCCKVAFCKKIELECCQEHPVCPSGTVEDDTCSLLDVAVGRCTEQRRCCKSVRCRSETQ